MFSRVQDIFKANVNDALDNMEDAEKMLKQSVLEIEEAVNIATMSVAQAIANEKSLDRKLEKAKKEKEEWQTRAMQAVNANRDDLAKSALERKAIVEKNILDLEPIFIQAKETANKLRGQLDTTKSKLEEVRQRQGVLIARSQAAKAEKQLSQSLAGIGDSAIGKFDKMEQKIEKLESEASAYSQLAGETTSLDDEFKKLSVSSSSDDELLKLKAQMGKLPGSETKQLSE
ncbi:MAG: PspA/IM30 family protein [Candidatus Kapabacteria bacterium]|nr:PspA/IM30 family protein [Candidatus Kapabacteria bacterium]